MDTVSCVYCCAGSIIHVFHWKGNTTGGTILRNARICVHGTVSCLVWIYLTDYALAVTLSPLLYNTLILSEKV
jgi:hypothetical protein